MAVRGHRLTVGNLIASNAPAGHAKTLLNCVPTRTKVNSTKSQLLTNCSALARLPAPLVLIYKREWVFLVGKKRGGGGGRKKVKSGERKLESECVFYFYFN